MEQVTTNVIDIDAALWPSETGYEMTWTNLSANGAPGTMIRFAAPGDHDKKQPLWVGFAEGAYAELKLKERRIIFSGTPHPEFHSSYEYTILDDGSISLQYTLTRGSKILRGVTTRLQRAKVVM